MEQGADVVTTTSPAGLLSTVVFIMGDDRLCVTVVDVSPMDRNTDVGSEMLGMVLLSAKLVGVPVMYKHMKDSWKNMNSHCKINFV